jgi:dTDP-4-amino-4,6-dideoxygalactose transaminase
MQTMTSIPLNDLRRHNESLRREIDAAIARVVDRGWFVLGPEVEAFEAEFADFCGTPHAVGVANGTDALEIALRALGVAEGDEVVLAANAGMYTATALAAIGARAVYADVDEASLTLAPDDVAARITPRTRAVVATHLYGRMAEMPALAGICAKAGIALIEDCAQSHGAILEGTKAGAHGDAGCFSFYPTKNLGALGDGGLVTCRRRDVADRVRGLRQYGWGAKYVVTARHGRNSRLDELQAAVLRAKLPRLEQWNRRRREIACRYAEVSANGVRHPDTKGEDYVAHLYVLRCDRRDDLQRHLAAHGIGTDVHYPVLDVEQPIHGAATLDGLDVSRRATRQILTLPCFPEMGAEEIERVCKALQAWTR